MNPTIYQAYLLILCQGVRDPKANNEQGQPPTNEADLKDNKGESKESKLLRSMSTGEGSEEEKTKEEEKVVRTPGDEPGEGVSSEYRLRGVVVHSGQASGGHYYSFIRLRYSVVYPSWWRCDLTGFDCVSFCV